MIRWFHRTYAFLFGYSWFPCCICGQESGGHQWRDRHGRSSVFANRGICPACTLAGRGNGNGPQTRASMIEGGTCTRCGRAVAYIRPGVLEPHRAGTPYLTSPGPWCT